MIYNKLGTTMYSPYDFSVVYNKGSLMRGLHDRVKVNVALNMTDLLRNYKSNIKSQIAFDKSKGWKTYDIK